MPGIATMFQSVHAAGDRTAAADIALLEDHNLRIRAQLLCPDGCLQPALPPIIKISADISTRFVTYKPSY